jgi:hypothetical protein
MVNCDKIKLKKIDGGIGLHLMLVWIYRILILSLTILSILWLGNDFGKIKLSRSKKNVVEVMMFAVLALIGFVYLDTQGRFEEMYFFGILVTGIGLVWLAATSLSWITRGIKKKFAKR